MRVRASRCGSSTGAAARRLLHWFDVRLPVVLSVTRVCDLSQTGRDPCTHRVLRKRRCTCRAHCAEPHRRSTSAPSTGRPAYCEAAFPESATCHTSDSQRRLESERRSTRRSPRARAPIHVREAAALQTKTPSIGGHANDCAERRPTACLSEGPRRRSARQETPPPVRLTRRGGTGGCPPEGRVKQRERPACWRNPRPRGTVTAVDRAKLAVIERSATHYNLVRRAESAFVHPQREVPVELADPRWGFVLPARRARRTHDGTDADQICKRIGTVSREGRGPPARCSTSDRVPAAESSPPRIRLLLPETNAPDTDR